MPGGTPAPLATWRDHPSADIALRGRGFRLRLDEGAHRRRERKPSHKKNLAGARRKYYYSVKGQRDQLRSRDGSRNGLCLLSRRYAGASVVVSKPFEAHRIIETFRRAALRCQTRVGPYEILDGLTNWLIEAVQGLPASEIRNLRQSKRLKLDDLRASGRFCGLSGRSLKRRTRSSHHHRRDFWDCNNPATPLLRRPLRP
jgi:hypothetical protein